MGTSSSRVSGDDAISSSPVSRAPSISIRLVLSFLDARSILSASGTCRRLSQESRDKMVWSGEHGCVTLNANLMHKLSPSSLLRSGMAPVGLRVRIAEPPTLGDRLWARISWSEEALFPGLRILQTLPASLASLSLRLHTLSVQFDQDVVNCGPALLGALQSDPVKAMLLSLELQTQCHAFRNALRGEVYASLRDLPRLQHLQMPFYDFLHPEASAGPGGVCALPLRQLTLGSMQSTLQGLDIELGRNLERLLDGPGSVLAQSLKHLSLWRLAMLDRPAPDKPMLASLSHFAVLERLDFLQCGDLMSLLRHPPSLPHLRVLMVELPDVSHVMARFKGLSECGEAIRSAWPNLDKFYVHCRSDREGRLRDAVAYVGMQVRSAGLEHVRVLAGTPEGGPPQQLTRSSSTEPGGPPSLTLMHANSQAPPRSRRPSHVRRTM